MDRSRVRAALSFMALVLAAATAVAGCGAGETSGEARLTIYVSAPADGPLRSTGEDIADGARLALEDAGNEAAGTPVEAVYLSDSEAGSATGWSGTAAAANARLATQDSTSIAYVGDFSSGATRSSLPITNEAGLLQVSPGASADDLTGDDRDDTPAQLEPTGERTFGRVVPSDSIQAEATVAWAQELGVGSMAVLGDGSGFAESQSAALERAGSRYGMRVEGEAAGLADPDAFYLAWQPVADEVRLDSFRRAPPDGFFTSEPVVGTRLDEGLLAQVDGPLRISSAAMFPGELPPAGLEWTTAFGKRFGRKPGAYAAYGYEAMAVVLDAIERADDPLSREDVIDAFFATSERDSILGTYTIDGDGDTSLDRVGAYERGPEGRITSLDAISP